MMRNTKKKLLIVLALFAIVVLVLTFMRVFVPDPPRREFDRQKFDMLYVGMGEQEVMAILEEPGQRDLGVSGTYYKSWTWDNLSIHLAFSSWIGEWIGEEPHAEWNGMLESGLMIATESGRETKVREHPGGVHTSRLWQAFSRALNDPVRTLDGHKGSVLSVAFSSDGKTLATASRDKTIKLWEIGHDKNSWLDIPTGKLRQTLSDHTADVYCVVFSPQGDLLASGSGDKTIRLWDARTRKTIRILEGHGDVVRSVAFSPDQKTLVSGSKDQTVRLWDVATGQLQQTLEGHTGQVRSVAFSPDGTLLASGCTDKTARLWDARTAQLKLVLKGHTGSIEHVAFSPDGKRLASSSEDSTVRLWDVATGKLRLHLKGHRGEVDSVAFSPDGKITASGSKDKSIKLWDAPTGKLLETLTGHTGRVESLAFSPDGNILATGGGGGDTSVKLWDVRSAIARP